MKRGIFIGLMIMLIVSMWSVASAFSVRVVAEHDVALYNIAVSSADPYQVVFTDKNGLAPWPSPPAAGSQLETTTWIAAACSGLPGVTGGSSPDHKQTITVPPLGEVVTIQVPPPSAAYDAGAWSRRVVDDVFSEKELELARELNAYRAGRKMEKLPVLKRLNYVADRHLTYLGATNQFSHCNNEGMLSAKTVLYAGIGGFDPANNNNVLAPGAGDVLGAGDTKNMSAKAMLTSWLGSQQHRAYLDRSDLTAFGIAVTDNYYMLLGVTKTCLDQDLSERNACESSRHSGAAAQAPKPNVVTKPPTAKPTVAKFSKASAQWVRNRKCPRGRQCYTLRTKVNISQKRLVTTTARTPRGKARIVCRRSASTVACAYNVIVPLRYRQRPLTWLRSQAYTVRFVAANTKMVTIRTRF